MDTLVSRDNKIDLQKFNSAFDKEKQRVKEEAKQKQQKRLDELNKPPPQKMIHEYSVGEIIIGVKDTWFDILDDILQYGITKDLLNKKNRLFFVGVTIVLIILILYLHEFIFGSEKKLSKSNSIEVRHIH